MAHFPANGHSPRDPSFPALPILSASEVPRTAREKYGGLFYLGVAGLLVIALLLTWFAVSAWSLRTLWWNVYVLHDGKRPEAERVGAAYAIARDPNANQRQLWEIALRKPLPPLARYVVAESLKAEAAVADPRGYGQAVARSEGWPNWLRLLLTRPLAYAATLGRPVHAESLSLLARHSDPAVALWADFALASGPSHDPIAAAALRRGAKDMGPFRELAQTLVRGLDLPALRDRLRALDDATLWLRDHHPDAVQLWQGWRVTGGRLRPIAAP